MASKYNITGALTPVKSTFVDPGLATFKEAAIMHRKNYDTNKDAYNLTKRVVGQMQLMPGDEDAGLRDEFAGTIDQSFEQIVASGAYEDADMAVQNAVSFITSDKTVLAAQQNAAQYLKEESLIDQYGPSGVLDFNNNSRATFTTKGKDNEGNDVVNSYRENMEQKEGYAAFMTDLVAGIAKDGSPWMSDRYGVTPEQVGQYLSYGTSQGVSQTKMENIVEDLYETYIDDKVGDQDYRRLKEINGLSDPDIKRDIINRMKAIGQSQVGNIATLSGMKDMPKLGQDKQISALTIDNWTKSILNKGPQRIDPTTFKSMTGGVDGDVANSVAISGQNGIVLDFASQMPIATKNKIAQALVAGNIASDVDEAAGMVGPLLNFLVAEESGKTDLAVSIATQLGFDYSNESSKKMLQTISQRLKTVVDQSTLDNMGGILKAENITGSFRPNMGDSYNSEMIGGSLIVDGRYLFNKEQMNNMASQTGAGSVGAWFFGFDPSGDDIENQEDASGKPLWQNEGEIDGVEYWSIAGKSQPIAYSAQTADKWWLETHPESDFTDWQVTINETRDMARDMDQTNVGYVSKITSDVASLNIPQSMRKETAELGKAYLGLIMQRVASSPSANSVQLYSQISAGLRKTINEAAGTPGADRAFVQKKINEFYYAVFPPTDAE